MFSLLASAAFGQIALVGGCAAVATSCTPVVIGGGVFATGQYEYTFAYKSSVTAPTLATSYTTLDTASASSSSFRSGCAVMTSSTPFNTTWTGATNVVTLIYSGEAATNTANCVTTGIGGKATGTGATSTISYTTITMTHANASSWVIGAVGSSAAVCTPATVLHSEESATDIIGNDSNGVVSSFSTLTCTGTTGNWKSDTVELLAAAVANPTIAPNGGTFGMSSSANLSDATGSSTICYTTDGSTPAATTSGTCSSGSTYSSALTITGSGTVVNALGTKSGLSNSAVTTSSRFTINPFFPNLASIGVSGALTAPPLTLLSHCVANGTGTCTIDTTGASLIIVDQITGGSSTLGAAPTENKGNTFQTPAATKCTLGSSAAIQVYYIFNPTVGSGHIFTGGAASNGYFVSAWSNMLPTSAVYDTGNCNSQTGGSGLTFQPGSVTPAGTNELILSMAFNVDSSGGTWTVPTSFSFIDSCTCFSSESTAYYVDPSSSAINPTWTNLNNQNFVGNIAVFKHQ